MAGFEESHSLLGIGWIR